MFLLQPPTLQHLYNPLSFRKRRMNLKDSPTSPRLETLSCPHPGRSPSTSRLENHRSPRPWCLVCRIDRPWHPTQLPIPHGWRLPRMPQKNVAENAKCKKSLSWNSSVLLPLHFSLPNCQYIWSVGVGNTSSWPYTHGRVCLQPWNGDDCFISAFLLASAIGFLAHCNSPHFQELHQPNLHRHHCSLITL